MDADPKPWFNQIFSPIAFSVESQPCSMGQVACLAENYFLRLCSDNNGNISTRRGTNSTHIHLDRHGALYRTHLTRRVFLFFFLPPQ